MAVAFFDIGDTLATPLLSPNGELADLKPLSGVLETLGQLQARQIRMGVISETDASADEMREFLERAGLFRFLDPRLLLYSSEEGLRKDSPEIFRRAIDRAGADGSARCVFVGEEKEEREFAAQAGMRVAPHPRLAIDALEGRPLRYLRITAPESAAKRNWRTTLRTFPIVPLLVTGAGGTTVYAIGTSVTAAELDDLGFAIDRLGADDAPNQTDLFLLRDDRQVRTGFLNPEGQSAHFFANTADASLLLTSSPEGLFAAVPAGRSVDDYHFPEAQHGHTQKLIADFSLLEPFTADPGAARFASWLGASTSADPGLKDEEHEVLREITPERIGFYLDPYTGARALDETSGFRVRSRHIRSEDNLRVTRALARSLQRIGGDMLQVRITRFGHDGHRLDNVEAELAGSGTEGIVLVTAHLDSTAQSDEGGYNAALDPAPGADDDGSGVAAVLAIAEASVELARIRRPARSLRFVLFNAEEQGLVGSKIYARAAAAEGTPIIAVYQMDMIGFRTGSEFGQRPFELHAGFVPSADVQARSLALAERVARLTSVVSPTLATPQIYSVADPADGRSDHASFQERGYAACVASEDFFLGPGAAAPAPQPNPNYHRRGDTDVDLQYAADIARVVAAAAWISANV
jgi:hypothetical protein